MVLTSLFSMLTSSPPLPLLQLPYHAYGILFSSFQDRAYPLGTNASPAFLLLLLLLPRLPEGPSTHQRASQDRVFQPFFSQLAYHFHQI